MFIEAQKLIMQFIKFLYSVLFQIFLSSPSCRGHFPRILRCVLSAKYIYFTINYSSADVFLCRLQGEERIMFRIYVDVFLVIIVVEGTKTVLQFSSGFFRE